MSDTSNNISKFKSLEVDEPIELRLKPQHSTFSFPNGESNDFGFYHNGKSTHGVYTEKTLDPEVIEKEHRREEALNNEYNKTHERNKKPKPNSILTVDAKGLLLNLNNLRSLSDISGTESMAILLLFINELIWITENLENNKLTNQVVSDNLFDEELFKSVLNNFNKDNKNLIISNENSSENNSENNELSEVKNILQPIINEITGKKERLTNLKRLELISKSQEELGVSLRKSSKILSNFETDPTYSINEKDLAEYIENNIGEYEKCSNDEETVNCLAKKFYLKTAPKMELDKYIDRINSNLEVSGATGLCAGWFLFKFIFNLRCNEKLSDGINNIKDLQESKNPINWGSRSIPLTLGNSFLLDSDDDANVTKSLQSFSIDHSFSSINSTNSINSSNSTKQIKISKVSKLNAFRLILTCVRISSKLIEDKNFKQQYYCKVTGLQKLEDLFRLELALGYGLDWELFTNEYTLWRYLFHIQAFVQGCSRLREIVNNS